MSTGEKNKLSSPWPFRLWLLATILLVLIGAVVSTAWAVKDAIWGSRLTERQAKMILAVANFPGQVRVAANQLQDKLGGDPSPLLLDRSSVEKEYWVRKFPAEADKGYLLFSGTDHESRVSIVALIRISDGKILARWVPDWDEIIRRTTPSKYVGGFVKQNMSAVHPALLPNGDLVFNTSGSMVRMTTCTSKPVWVLDVVVHHSNELDNEGNIWAPSISRDGFVDNPWLLDRVRDDALAKISPNGELLERRSFAKIMRDNGLEPLLLGTQGVRLNDDPIHINQIAVARNSTAYWQRGDLLVSARHLSTIFLYRPATGRIIWHKTGPWMNQHSVAFVGDHQISVFDNHVVIGPGGAQFMSPGETNRVMVYNFQTNQVSEPFAKLIAEAKPVTMTGGRAQLLADGGLFIEETNFGRHLRFTKDQLLWSRINDYDEKHIGIVAWSRYLTAEEIRSPLRALSKKSCGSVQESIN